MKKITVNDFEKILGFQIDEITASNIEKFDFKYRDLTSQERNDYLIDFLDVLTKDIVVSGKHRINEWERGWEENLNFFKKTKKIEDLIPKYHGKNKIVRWMGDVVMPITENFDYKIHICFIDAVLNYYSKNFNNILEFGCGPAYHLVRLGLNNSNINLYGLDWTKTSQTIINEINKSFDLNISGYNFDFFDPKLESNFVENSLIFTVAALEQVGNKFEKFVNFLIDKKAGLCVHFEPIDELLDEKKLIDNLSIKYFRKRNYLNKFLPHLENLEKNKKIKIIKKQRIFSGSYFIEGHSLIIWKPLNL